jgi:hypothetical protein
MAGSLDSHKVRKWRRLMARLDKSASPSKLARGDDASTAAC